MAEDVREAARLAGLIGGNVAKVIVGKEGVINKVLIALLAGGHILLEDLPGTGKTTLAKALARSIQCGFGRVQFTPDLLPSDLTGINFYNQKLGEFQFRRGALFTNILLADEINRATPRTQSSLLECMEEGQVSVDGETYPLPPPFLVIATQNPVEIQGTFPLPEAQLDRFLFRLSLGYPGAADEREMLGRHGAGSPLPALSPVATGEQVVAAQRAVRGVRVGEAVAGYIVAIAAATREESKIRLGLSPRGSLMLLRAAQARAAVAGRGYVAPEDVKAVCADVLCHRLVLSAHRGADDTREAVRQILLSVPVPTEQAL